MVGIPLFEVESLEVEFGVDIHVVTAVLSDGNTENKFYCKCIHGKETDTQVNEYLGSTINQCRTKLVFMLGEVD